MNIFFFIPHVQAHQGVQLIQGVPWAQKVHAHHLVQLFLAFLFLPVGGTLSSVRIG